MTKVLGKVFHMLVGPISIGVVLSVVLGLFTAFYYLQYQDAEALESYPIIAEINRLHNLTVDFRLRQRGPRHGSEDVAILTIDDRALEKYGRWPWSRDIVAKVLDEVMNAGAKTLSFDIIFSETDDSLINALSKVENRLNQTLPSQKPLISEFFEAEKETNNFDKLLTSVIEKHSEKLILGAVFDEVRYEAKAFQDYCFDRMNVKTGIESYWSEQDAYILGALDKTDINIPERMGKIINEHLVRLDQNVTYDWLQSKVGKETVDYLNALGLSPEKAAPIELITLFIQDKPEKFDELKTQHPKLAKISGKQLLLHMGQKQRIDLHSKMKQENQDYCLRYLTSEDELMPTFKANWDLISRDSPTFGGMTFDEGLSYIYNNSLYNPVHQVGSMLLNIKPIRDVTTSSGTFNASQDKDGSIRRARLFVRSGSRLIPTLAFKAYLVANDLYPYITFTHHPREDVNVTKIVSEVQIRNNEDKPLFNIPTDYRGQLPINYAGPQKMFAYLSAAELLEGSDTITIEQRVKNSKGEWVEESRQVNKKEWIKGKNFIFGATATAIYDLRVTPFQENFPGVETHANLLDNLLRKDYLRTSSNEEYIMPWAILGIGVLFSIIVSKLGAIFGLLVASASLFGVYLVDSLYFFPQGVVVTMIFPVFTILFLYTFITFFKYFTEERKKQQLKGTFQKYVSPEIVNEILKDPSKLELGGIKQEMTVFFSDVRGFTTISEKLDPRALSDLLNHYLTPMTEIIFQNSGTLDKYMGDAIMAFFGAPVPSEKHAAQACRAALIQIRKLFELQKIYEEQGLPQIDIGIGINTGEMSVGNMGSETVRNYTVMGDAVNLGSRLEGINKQYGTRIIISEFTNTQIKNDGFIVREIDWVKVKGKNEPVRIFELMDEGEPSAEFKKRLDHFVAGFHFYHEMQWEQAISSFNASLNIEASDRVSQLYIERCQDYMKNPPGNDWDGVFTMTTK
ncbi:MAG: adenylate/guanylate cyclase domain-containing protein [Bdellovibrionales bacterium]|nr:adenylate/guanylate cyclase domain-containing protein [Bdellovibrionales bacterium]